MGFCGSFGWFCVVLGFCLFVCFFAEMMYFLLSWNLKKNLFFKEMVLIVNGIFSLQCPNLAK